MEQKLQSYLNNIASYFKKSKSHSIGVDIGGNNLKIVELQKKGDKIKLKNYALVKIEKDLSRDELRKFSGEMVSQILTKMSIKSKDVNIALPSYSSLMTLMEISGKTKEEIKSEIEYEAPKYIPVDLSEVVFDWQIIDDDPENLLEKSEKASLIDKKSKENTRKEGELEDLNIGSRKVLLVSVMKNISNKYQKSFDKNGLNINSIELDCFSMKRSLLVNQKKNYVILDIGGKITNIVGIYKGQLLFNRNVDLAGDKITDLISKSLNVNKERAEKIKIEQGFESDSKNVVENILEPIFNSISDKILKSLNEFEEFKNVDIEKIILSGGTSEIKGAKEYIESRIKKDVVYGNPWSQIDYPKEIEKKILKKSPFFGVAVGLALINFED